MNQSSVVWKNILNWKIFESLTLHWYYWNKIFIFSKWVWRLSFISNVKNQAYRNSLKNHCYKTYDWMKPMSLILEKACLLLVCNNFSNYSSKKFERWQSTIKQRRSIKNCLLDFELIAFASSIFLIQNWIYL